MMDDDRHRKFTGIDKFHAAGYYGSGIVAASGESWSLDYYNPGGLCEDPFNEGAGTGHAVDTASTFFQVAPKARLVMLPTSAKLASKDPEKNSYDKFITKAIPVIKELGITNMFNSFTHSYDTYTFTLWQTALRSVEDKFKCFFAMGNDGSNRYNKITDIEEVIGVSAYTLLVSGELVTAYYSSLSETTDFAAPSMIYTNPFAESSTSPTTSHSGTSFSTPWLCGMSCLVDEFFIDKTGRPLSRSAMVQFMIDNCMDISVKGFDEKSGHGAVILPDPKDIDIGKYQPSDVDTPIIPDEGEEPIMNEEVKITKSGEYTTIIEIPFKSIEKLDFDLCAQPKETLSNYYKRQDKKPDILINGGLFSLSTGENIMSFINDGKVYGTVEGYRGLGIKADRPDRLVYGTDKEEWNDFMPCFPMLVMNGKAVPSSEYYGAASLNYLAARQAIGYNDESIIIITVDRNDGVGGMKFEKLAELFIGHGATYAMALDGGGSVRTMVSGEVVNTPTENRAVDNIFAVYLKQKTTEDPETPTADIDLGEYYIVEASDGHAGANEESAKMYTIPVGTKVDIQAVIDSGSAKWCMINYDCEFGFVKFTGSNIAKCMPVEPEMPEIPSAPEIEPELYKVNVSDASRLMVRNGPGTEYAVIDKLCRDDEVLVYEITDTGWARINTTEPYLYAFTKYLDKVEVTEPDVPEVPNEVPEPEPVPDILDCFQDKDDISSWAIESVRRMVGEGVFAQADQFNPKSSCTREEMAVVADRIVKLLRK